jgi:hypothetical protein
MHKTPTRLLTSLLFPAILFACHQEDASHQAAVEHAATEPAAEPEMIITEGSCGTVFEGEICSWSKSKAGELVSFGATVPMSTVESAPSEGEMAWPPVTHARVAMTDEVKAATGIDHLGVNWEIFGHPPLTFMTPHFDFHFYMLPGDEVAAIDCEDLTMPDPGIVPEGYVLPDEYIPEMDIMLIGLCVPEMGMHAVNAEEAGASELFDGTFIVGFIYGNPHFIEPMIAKKLLDRREDFTVALPEVKGRGEGKANPAAFNGYYDKDIDSYHLTFTMAESD